MNKRTVIMPSNEPGSPPAATTAPRHSAEAASRGRLRVAIIAPPWTPVPPTAYGGIEAVVDELAVGLHRAGHEVLLYSTGDSKCPVPRQSVLPQAEGDRIGHVVPERRHVAHAYDAVQGFDIVHDHTILGPSYAGRFPHLNVVSTIHGPLDAELADLCERVAHRVDLIAISQAQGASAPNVPISRVIPHGVDVARFPEGRGTGGFCVFLGRMCADKGAHRALDVARRAGVKLVLAGKMRTRAERDYFEAEVKPRLGHDAWYVGEVSHERKLEILGKAWCLLFPIRWAEPFGLVMIESLACGTPVLAFPEGAAPEVVEHGRTGFLCRDEEDMAEAVSQVGRIDRQACRREVETTFSSHRMVGEHIELFQEVLARRPAQPEPSTRARIGDGGNHLLSGLSSPVAAGTNGTPRNIGSATCAASAGHLTTVTDRATRQRRSPTQSRREFWMCTKPFRSNRWTP